MGVFFNGNSSNYSHYFLNHSVSKQVYSIGFYMFLVNISLLQKDIFKYQNIRINHSVIYGKKKPKKNTFRNEK